MASPKKRLGKGLDAIFGEDIDTMVRQISDGENEFKGNSIQIKINDIRPNPYQPRKIFEPGALEELSASIKEHGVFNPILVRKSLKGYELVAGERRLRASKLAKLDKIPAIVVNFDDKAMMEISLLENIQRENLSPLEEAKAYEQLLKKLSYTQEQLSKRVNKSRAYITNTLRLLKLPIKIQELLNKGSLTYGHARALLALDDEDKMVDLANRCVKEKLSVRDIEKLVKGRPQTVKPVKKTNPYLNSVKHNMEEKLGTKVDISNNKIVVHYTNTKDLNRILEILDLLEEN